MVAQPLAAYDSYIETRPSKDPLDVVWDTEPYGDVSPDPAESPSSDAESLSLQFTLDEIGRVLSGLTILRSDEDQERFFFTNVKRFILNHRQVALAMIDRRLASPDASVTARYYYASLLGHIIDDATVETRMSLVEKYSRSNDPGFRTGAQEAREYLELV